MESNNEHFDFKTDEGKMFLVGYRKFIVAMIWMGLMAFGVVMNLLFLSKPTSGQNMTVIWLIASSGFFSAVFVGGNVLAKLWAKNFNIKTTANLSDSTEQVDKTARVITVDSSQDAAFSDAEKTLPAAKPRSK